MATQVLDNPKIGGRLRTYVRELREETNKFISAWRASFFILGVVSSNSFVEYAIVGNLIDFITSIQGKKLAPAAVTIFLTNGLSSFLDILGAFVSDARLGRYRVILISITSYMAGMGVFVLSVSLELPELAETVVFYIALFLIAAGRCGQCHTLREFGLDQFKSGRCVDETKARIHTRVWWYLGKLVGVVAGVTTNSILTKKATDDDDENQYWKSAGTYSLLTMAVTLLLFLSGTLLYTHVKPRGSPLTRILRVFVAALRNRGLRCSDHANELYEEKNLQNGVLVRDPQGNTNEPVNASQLIEDQQLLQENLPDDDPSLSDQIGEIALELLRNGSTWITTSQGPEEHGEEDQEAVLLSRDQNGEVAPADAGSSSKVNPPEDDPHLVASESKDQVLHQLPHTDGLRCLDKEKEHGEEDQEAVLLSRDQNGEVAPADAGSSSKVNPPEDDPHLVASESKDQVLHQLPHTDGLRCLDKAATIDPCQDLQELVRKWKLCTVTQVEETKVLLRMFPIWATFLIFGVVLQLGNSLFLVQGGTLDNQLSRRTVVPLTALLAVSGLSDVATTEFLLPLLNRVLKLDKGIPPKVKIAIGLFISILCCITAAEVEAHRLKVVENNELIDYPDEIVPMSIFWLFPQFILLGVIDGLAGDGLEDFFDDHVPSEMRIYKHLSSESVFGAGSLLIALLVVIAAETSKLTGRRSWFKDSVNTSRLNYFYWLVAILSVINLFCYVFLAVKCSPRKFRGQEEDEEKI